jgi:hypothetical protein
MADPVSANTTVTTDQGVGKDGGPLKQSAPAIPPNVLSGAQKLLDGTTHVGVAVLVTSDGKPSTLMIPDVTNLAKGQPVYITKPIRIDGKNLKDFLATKGVTLPAEVVKLIGDTKISCDAFYYTNSGPLLMTFALNFSDGLIQAVTGDESLGKLFDIQGAAVRVLRCPESAYQVLVDYTAELAAD